MSTDHDRVLRLLGTATFLVFFQAFMIAPLIPRLAAVFHEPTSFVGLAVPGYLIPYGIATLVWGPVSDRFGRAPVILGSLSAFVCLAAATAAMPNAASFLALRVVTALGASGVVPISLAFVGDVIEPRRRGHALGWLFGAMAGGTAFGSSAGAMLEPVIGWRGLFFVVAAAAAAVLVLVARRRAGLGRSATAERRSLRFVFVGYGALLQERRARRTYLYVVINAMLHGGIYTWLGLYFERRFGLGEVGIGLALLGYGVPGFLLGPVIGRLADRRGRARLIPLGLLTAAVAAAVVALPVPLLVAAAAIALLSLGYDLTQPLLATVVTQLSAHRGQAMGLNVFALFVGSGLGAVIFQTILTAGFTRTLAIFSAAAALAAAIGLTVFANEGVMSSPTPDTQ